METNLTAEEHLFVKKGDIAYNMMRMWQGASGLASYDALVSPAYVVLRAKTNIYPLFAAYLFKLPRIIHSFWAYSYGITDDRLRLYFKDFAAIPIALPPLAEQQKIAEILFTWDHAIAVQERLIANAQAQKKALLQALLTQRRRLPGFSRNWIATNLNKISIVSMGSSPPSTAYNNVRSGLPLIQGNADISNRLAVPRFFTSEITQTCDAGDIIFSVRAPVGEIATATERACLGRGVAGLRPRADSDRAYLYYVLMHAEDRWVSLSQGSTFQAISGDALKGFEFYAPPTYEERKAIGDIIGNADALEISLVEQLDKYKQEKSALMQELLTGKRRVKIMGDQLQND
jgi:type I restriction enzyme S subunit